MKSFWKARRSTVRGIFVCLLVVSFAASVATAQRIDGTLRGTVTDSSGAIVPAAQVTATNEATGVSRSTQTSSAGVYVFPNLLVGTYTLEIKAKSFATSTRKGVPVSSNAVTEASAKMEVGAAETVVEVSGIPDVVQTNTSQLSNTFDARMASLPVGSVNGSVLSLSALAPNTTLMGSGVLGQGGSVGGTRPRMNGFQIDGVDNNDVGVTGFLIDPIGDAVQEFQLITNQFSAEYGHSAGAQFNVITKSGTNAWHGEGHEYNVNRDFLAMDNLEKGSGLTEPRRFDQNRFGGSVGGPIVKNKIFIFGAYEYKNRGRAASSVEVLAPTADGLQTLNALAANQSVRDVLAHFPVAAAADSTQTVNGVAIPVGPFQAAAPDFFNNHSYQINGDMNLGKHSLRLRYLYDRLRQPNLNADLPQSEFTGSNNVDNKKGIISDAWTINNHLVNDFRASYSRNVNDFTVPAAFANFGNFEIDKMTLDVGPEPNSPQGAAQNSYQLADSLSWVKGSHTFKFGGEFRLWIAPTDFLPRARGEFDYGSLQTFINDQVPDGLNGALRGAGDGSFAGNQKGIYWYVQDDWKATRKLTLNLGLRYEWVGNPRDARKQALNSIASVPGLFDFRVPKDDKNNFGPHVGFAYDPFGNGKWAIRGGFQIAYDVTFQNLTLLQLPPQLQTEQNPDLTCSGAAGPPPAWCGSGNGFLAGGGLAAVNVPPATAADARSATQSIIVDTVAPKIMTWSLGIQHEMWHNGTIELRYLGTHAVSLPVQNRRNAITIFENGFAGLPTFLNASQVPGTVSSTALTRQDALNTEDLRFSAQGFDGGFITAFDPVGQSIYHSGSVDFNQRVSHGLSLRANYTYAHNIDNSTNELFSSRVNPRRPEDFGNIPGERGRSVLDIRSKVALSWVYDVPTMSFARSGFLNRLLGGWQYAATWVAQTGQPITPLSGVDTNGNLDSAGDRAFFNPTGIPGTGTDVSFVCGSPTGATFVATSIGSISSTGAASGCGVGQIAPLANADGTAATRSGNNFVVGYVANNPNAQFVVGQLGALVGAGMTRSGRDQVSTPGLQIWNMTVNKKVRLAGESKYAQFTVNAFNVFNHRNFSLVNPDVFQSNVNGLSTSFANVSSSQFLDAKQFNGGKRTLQLALKIVF